MVSSVVTCYARQENTVMNVEKRALETENRLYILGTAGRSSALLTVLLFGSSCFGLHGDAALEESCQTTMPIRNALKWRMPGTLVGPDCEPEKRTKGFKPA